MKRSPSTWQDPKTGMEWQYESPGEMTWYEALEYAKSLSLGGKDDWRIPTVLELDTLLDKKTLFDKMRPDMRKEVPFRDILPYWSPTTFAPNTYKRVDSDVRRRLHTQLLKATTTMSVAFRDRRIRLV